MIIGVLREAQTGETRVAATPATVVQLLKLGYEVVVETGAGDASSFADEAYVEAGASIGDPFDADIVLGVNQTAEQQLDQLRKNATLIVILNALLDASVVADLTSSPFMALSMDSVSRNLSQPFSHG